MWIYCRAQFPLFLHRQISSSQPLWRWLCDTFNSHPSLHSAMCVLCTSCRLPRQCMCCWLTWVGGWTDCSALSCSATRMYCKGWWFAQQLPLAINWVYILLLTEQSYTCHFPTNYTTESKKKKERRKNSCHVAVSSAANLSGYLEPESYPPHLSTRPTWTKGFLFVCLILMTYRSSSSLI